jgi:hypothetical protein
MLLDRVIEQQALFRWEGSAESGVERPELALVGGLNKSVLIEMPVKEGVSDQQQVRVLSRSYLLKLTVIGKFVAPSIHYEIEGREHESRCKQSMKKGWLIHGGSSEIDVNELGGLAAEGVDQKNGEGPHGGAKNIHPEA